MMRNLCKIFMLLSLASAISALKLVGVHDSEPYTFFDIKSSIKMQCSADEAVEILWFKNNSEIKDVKALHDRYKISVSDGKKKSELIIEKAQSDDSGDYTCRAKGKEVAFMVIANIAVKLPSNTAVTEEEKVKFHCIAVGYEPTIDWYLPNGTRIDDDSEDPRISIETEGNVDNNVLVIANTRKSDRGTYTCKGRHAVEEIQNIKDSNDIEISSSSYLRVKGKFAALWPFIGICSEVFLLCAVIVIYEKRRNKNEAEESDTDQSPEQKNDHQNVRHRK